MDNLSDDGDIRRDIRCMYTRCNMLRRRFYNCSMSVKVILFKLFCLCFYNIALWNRFRIGVMNKFHLKAAFARRRCDMLCTSGFIDDVIFAHNR